MFKSCVCVIVNFDSLYIVNGGKYELVFINVLCL